MAHKIDNKTFVVLLPQEEDSSVNKVDRWLKKKGYITWKASDFQHVMEELSDYTVEKRPHVVLLSVNSLSQRFEAIRTTLKTCSGSDMTVLGFASRPAEKSGNRYFAHDLEGLERMICTEAQPSAAFHLN